MLCLVHWSAINHSSYNNIETWKGIQSIKNISCSQVIFAPAPIPPGRCDDGCRIPEHQHNQTRRTFEGWRDEHEKISQCPNRPGYVFNKSWRQKARVRPRHLMFNDQTLSTLSVPSFCQTSTTTLEHLWRLRCRVPQFWLGTTREGGYFLWIASQL